MNESGDGRDDLGAIFEAHRTYAVRVAQRFAPSPDDAEDIVQEVAVSFLQKAPRNLAHVRTWLFASIRNRAINTWHSQQARMAREARYLHARPEPVCDPDSQVIANERAEALRSAIDTLPPKYRQRMRHDLAGRTVSTNSTQSRTRRLRAKRMLAAMLSTDPRVSHD